MDADCPFDLKFLDESEIHLLPHLTRMWMPKGSCVEVATPGTNRKVPLFGALDYRTNRLSYRVGTGKDAAGFLAFAAELACECRDRPGVWVLDNVSYHTAQVVVDFLAGLAPTIQVVWLPPYSPELNDIERVWKYVKGASLANYYFGTVASLRGAIDKVFTELNNAEDHDLTLKLRDPLSGHLFRSA